MSELLIALLAAVCIFTGLTAGLSVAAFFFAWHAYSDRKFTADEAQALVNQAYRAGAVSQATGLPMVAPSVPTEPQRDVESIDSTQGPPDDHPFADGDDVDPAEAYDWVLQMHQSRQAAP